MLVCTKGGECEGRNREERRADQSREEEKEKKEAKSELMVRAGKQARNERRSLACARTNNRSDLSPLFCLFVPAFIPPPSSLHPSPNRVSYPLCFPPPPHTRSLSSLSVCPRPPLPVLVRALPPLAHLASTLRLGAIAANQTVYPSLISTLPHGGLLPPQNNESGPERGATAGI